MTDPYLYSVTNNVATFSINDAPWNLMSLEYIDRLEEQLPDVLADDSVRAMVFTSEGEAHFSAGMNLKQIPEGIKRAGSPEAFFGQRHRVLEMIERGGTPAALGEELARQPRLAVKSMLQVIVGHETKSLDESMAEVQAVAVNRGSLDSQEGMRAFMEKRKPVFNRT